PASSWVQVQLCPWPSLNSWPHASPLAAFAGFGVPAASRSTPAPIVVTRAAARMAIKGFAIFGSSCANDRRRKDNPSYTVVEVITTRGRGRELYPAATSDRRRSSKAPRARKRVPMKPGGPRNPADPTMGPGESAKALGCREREERIGPAERPGTRIDLQTQTLKGVEPEQRAVSGSSEHDPRRPSKSLALEDGLSDG